MEVQPMDKEDAAREKGIYHVTVVGSGVNFLLLLFKFFAELWGIVPQCWPMPSTRCRTL